VDQSIYEGNSLQLSASQIKSHLRITEGHGGHVGCT
jgi:hypothetical protein